MKPFILFVFLAMSAPLFGVDEVQTTAALPDNKQIWPLPKFDIPDVIRVKAEFKEQKEICSYTQGNWRTEVYLVTYTVSQQNTKYPHQEVTFIAEDKWPAKGSLIKVKKLYWPFRKGTLTFILEKDMDCDYTDFFKILSYNENS
jgi:hypothetical protein